MKVSLYFEYACMMVTDEHKSAMTMDLQRSLSEMNMHMSEYNYNTLQDESSPQKQLEDMMDGNSFLLRYKLLP